MNIEPVLQPCMGEMGMCCGMATGISLDTIWFGKMTSSVDSAENIKENYILVIEVL